MTPEQYSLEHEALYIKEHDHILEDDDLEKAEENLETSEYLEAPVNLKLSFFYIFYTVTALSGGYVLFCFIKNTFFNNFYTQFDKINKNLHKIEDNERRFFIDFTNNLDGLKFTTEKLLSDRKKELADRSIKPADEESSKKNELPVVTYSSFDPAKHYLMTLYKKKLSNQDKGVVSGYRQEAIQSNQDKGVVSGYRQEAIQKKLLLPPYYSALKLSPNSWLIASVDGYGSKEFLQSPFYEEVSKNFPDAMKYGCLFDSNQTGQGYTFTTETKPIVEKGYVFFPIIVVREGEGYNLAGFTLNIDEFMKKFKGSDLLPYQWIEPSMYGEENEKNYYHRSLYTTLRESKISEILGRGPRDRRVPSEIPIVISRGEYGFLKQTPQRSETQDWGVFEYLFKRLKENKDKDESIEKENEIIEKENENARVGMFTALQAAEIARGMTIGICQYLGLDSMPDVKEGLSKVQGILNLMLAMFEDAEFLKLFKVSSLTAFNSRMEKIGSKARCSYSQNPGSHINNSHGLDVNADK